MTKHAIAAGYRYDTDAEKAALCRTVALTIMGSTTYQPQRAYRLEGELDKWYIGVASWEITFRYGFPDEFKLGHQFMDDDVLEGLCRWLAFKLDGRYHRLAYDNSWITDEAANK